MKLERPQFELTRVLSDGTKEAPEVFPVGCVPLDTKMERRGFIGVGIGVASLLLLLDGKSPGQVPSASPQSGPGPDKRNSPPVKVPTKVLNAHTEMVRALALGGEGKILASASTDSSIKLWSMPDGKLLATLRDHKKGITGLAVSADGKILASSSWDTTIKLWSLPEGKLISTLEGHPGVAALVITAGGELITGSDDKTIKFWSLPEGKLIATVPGHRDSVSALATNREGKIVASGSVDRTIKIWSLAERKLLAPAGWHRDTVDSLALSADGTILASGSSDTKIRLWSLAKRRLIATLSGHTDPVSDLALTPDGRTLVSCSTDRTIKLWSVPAGKLLATLEGHWGVPQSLALTGDGKILASGDSSGVIILWDLERRSFLSFLFDPKASRTDAASYNVYDKITGMTLTYTLPCGSPIPPGAVCTCNCVPGTYSPPTYSAPSGGGSYCMCNKVCTCIPVPSDREVKEAFETADSAQILRRLSELPIQTWNYKWTDASVRHIGPMAQDFAALFGVGEDDKHIHPVDAQGVAFAAIQGLYHLLKEKEDRQKQLEIHLQEQETQNRNLKQRVEALERRISDRQRQREQEGTEE